MLIILFKYKLQPFKFVMTNCFEHVFAIRCIIKKAAAFSSRALFLEAHDIAHDHGADEVFRPNTFQIFFTSDPVETPELMENSRGKIEKLVSHFDVGVGSLRDELVAILALEVFVIYLEGFFLERVSNGFAYAKDHVEHKVPVVVANADECLGGVSSVQLVHMVGTLKNGPLSFNRILILFNHAQKLDGWAILLLFLFFFSGYNY